MPALIGPTTELEAVNEILASASEDRLLDIDLDADPLPPSASVALTSLRAVARHCQEEGAWFNREYDVELAVDTSTSKIPVPDNVLDIDVTNPETAIYQRGGYLYNADEHTFIFTEPVTCNIIYQRPWDELPQVARRYYTALALQRFIETYPGADATSPSRQENLARAQLAYERKDTNNADHNILRNSVIVSRLRRF